jgi:hypothetical protein
MEREEHNKPSLEQQPPYFIFLSPPPPPHLCQLYLEIYSESLGLFSFPA